MIEYEGYIKVPKSGRDRLTLRSTSAKFFLDQDLVIACDGLAPQEEARDLCLESGYHPMRIIKLRPKEQKNEIDNNNDGPEYRK